MEVIDTTLERRPIAQTKYDIDQNGFIYRKDRRLRSQYKNGRWYSTLTLDSGRRVNVDTQKLASTIFNSEHPPELTREMIQDKIKAIPLPDYPRYSITDYGAVYCMDPPRRGKNAGKMYLVSDRTNTQGHAYVVLYDYEGCRRCKRVSGLVESAWGVR